MKKWVVSVLVLLLLIGLTGCKEKEQNTYKEVSELLEPVGVQMDVAQAQMTEIFKVTTFNGQMVPYVEELQFLVDGNLGEMKVTLGDWVTEGQVLACLSEESIVTRMDELEENMAHIEKIGEFSDRQLMADIEIAKVELERLVNNGALKQTCRLKKVDVQKLENELEQARELRQLELQEKQREWKTLKEKLGNNEIVAPFEGRVVYIRDIKDGGAVQGYTTVLCLADERRVYLETEYMSESMVDSADRMYAKMGEKEYDIQYIPMDNSEYITKILNGEEVKTRFWVENGDEEVESGQFAVIMRIDSHKESVLTIPVNALYQDSGGKYVYKVTDGKRVRCNVTVGTITSTKAEITGGLEEGDFVYVKE